jgi:hypothetical protein
VAPLGRSADEFLTESEVHGWPSFRDNEVVWENVRVLKNSGETVAVSSEPRARSVLKKFCYCFSTFEHFDRSTALILATIYLIGRATVTVST